ncbi:MAG: hypothetical protein AAF557_11955 [Pseudomonadota bacterium]
MLISIIQDFSLNGIFVKSRGLFDPVHIGQMIQTISGLPVYADDVRILHNLRGVTFDLPMDEVLRVVHARRQKMRLRRLALVHDNELGFGMCRAIASMNDLKARRTEAFRTVPEALHWLYTCVNMHELPEQVARIHEERLQQSNETGPLQIFQDMTEARDEIRARGEDQVRVNPV